MSITYILKYSKTDKPIIFRTGQEAIPRKGDIIRLHRTTGESDFSDGIREEHVGEVEQVKWEVYEMDNCRPHLAVIGVVLKPLHLDPDTGKQTTGYTNYLCGFEFPEIDHRGQPAASNAV